MNGAELWAPDPSAPAPQQRAAPLSLRLGAMAYEGVLLFSVSFIADYLFDTLTQSRSGLMHRHAREAWLFLVIGAYFVYFWTHGGQTLAMKTWRIRLITQAGGAIPLGVALLRYGACWSVLAIACVLAWSLHLSFPASALVLSIALLATPLSMLFDRQRQFFYDRLLGTRLIRVDAAQPVVATNQ